MPVSATPIMDLSRTRLKKLARWIRDDLDLLVAREGPHVLRPDDVLLLHETFLALRDATFITCNDLRATGVHRAIQDIAGVATRWPSRLCDDCDEIIARWTADFGPFSELHPFLYGRGGRLEGIASAHEQGREALLKRWAETCPDDLHPKRSHRLGGFEWRAGDWWINTLFAYRAGIIGLESVEGGTTFDKHGAYAVVLKDTGEIKVGSESFTYRCPQADKGKFRLTAATLRSRDPIRVLRSHSINSVWGPKAGVRYEGLFSVTGWSIRQAKSADAAAGECNEGDMIYEVSFERKDPVPMEEVMKRPTATEVDDYVEFKRLSKLHREGKNILPASNSTQPLMRADIRLVTKTAPPIAPSEKLGPTHRNELESKSSHGSSIRKPTFKRMHFDKPEDSPYQPPDIVSPRTVPSLNSFPLDPNKPGTLSVPPKSEEPPLRTSHDKSSSEPRTLASPSVASSGLATSNSQIREVAPWIDFDAGLALPDAADVSPVTLDVTSLKASGGSRTNTSVMEAPKKRRSGEWFGTHLGLKGIFHQGHGEVGG